jgi:hypothetical protein
MQPLGLALHTQPTFIKVDKVSRSQLFLNGIECGLTSLTHGLIGLNDERRRGDMTIEIAKQLAGASHGQQLVVVEVAGLGFEPRPVLHSLPYIRGIHRFHLLLTVGACFDLDSMLGHFNAHRWYIKDLAVAMRQRLNL